MLEIMAIDLFPDATAIFMFFHSVLLDGQGPKILLPAEASIFV